jgi:hypothetical protein
MPPRANHPDEFSKVLYDADKQSRPALLAGIVPATL